MGEYQGIDCPVCHKPLDNGQPLAVCPDCGAPYHRECIIKSGECVYGDLHAAGKEWQPPQKEQEAPPEHQDTRNVCPRCGVINPVEGLFCEVCGSPLHAKKQETNPGYPPDFDGSRYHGNVGFQNQKSEPRGQGFQTPPQQMPYYPFTTPFGGLDPEDTIDEVPVKDVAIFVGQNTPYFLPKFKTYSEQKGYMSFNFAAFFFESYYLLYRKMYVWGIMAFIATTILSAPSLLLQIDQLRSLLIGADVAPLFHAQSLVTLSSVFGPLGFLLRFLIGFFANRLYKSHAMSKISSIRAENKDHNAYVMNLSKTGSVSMRMILILFGIQIVAMYAMILFLVF